MNRIELRNVKIAGFASHETLCFEAQLWRGDEQLGTVSNDGQGGSHMIHIKQGSNTVVTEKMVDDMLLEWEMKKMCKKKTLFRIPGRAYEDNEWHTLKNKFDAGVEEYLKAKYGNTVRILNKEL